jgi:hypothetical protein
MHQLLWRRLASCQALVQRRQLGAAEFSQPGDDFALLRRKVALDLRD